MKWTKERIGSTRGVNVAALQKALHVVGVSVVSRPLAKTDCLIKVEKS